MGSCKGNPRSGRLATIMGIGKAVPVHVFQQESYPDYYFDITGSNHMVDLKAKFTNICEKTTIEKRHLYTSDEWLRSNPSVTVYMSPSFNLRQKVTDAAIPRLGAEATLDAINDWGKQVTDITHLVFCTMSSGYMPGADFDFVKLLGLPLSTKRFMLYQVGCHGGGMALRLAKDVAENNPGARVLVVCSEVCVMGMRGPSETHIGNLIGQAIFCDDAAAVIVGACPTGEEKPLFEMVSASQDIIPGSEDAVVGRWREEGLVYNLHRNVPQLISSNIKQLATAVLEKAAGSVKDLNQEVFWVMHPGGRVVLDGVERALGLRKEKLEASREVMGQYGNTMSSCVIIALEEMRRRSVERRLRTAGEGLEWGLLFGFGPGLTVETIFLRALPNQEMVTRLIRSAVMSGPYSVLFLFEGRPYSVVS